MLEAGGRGKGKGERRDQDSGAGAQRQTGCRLEICVDRETDSARPFLRSLLFLSATLPTGSRELRIAATSHWTLAGPTPATQGSQVFST